MKLPKKRKLSDFEKSKIETLLRRRKMLEDNLRILQESINKLTSDLEEVRLAIDEIELL